MIVWFFLFENIKIKLSSSAKLVYILVRCFDASTSSATLAQQADLQIIEPAEMSEFNMLFALSTYFT